MAVTAAQAATLTISGTTGTWGNSVTSASPTYGALTGNGTSSLRWGVAAVAAVPGTTRSGYDFASSGPVTQIGAGSFLLGQYTHTNGTIWTSSTDLVRSDLSLTVTGTANGQAFSLSSAFRVSHNETRNSVGICPNNLPKPCGDTVGFALLTGAPLVITQGTTIFTILIDGFVRALGGPIVTSLLTPENQLQSLFLQASVQITTVPPPIPLPAGGALLLGGISLLALTRRRRS